jgi:hypothetical protein
MIAERDGTPWPATLPQYFDHLVKTLAESGGDIEPVAGIGQRATFAASPSGGTMLVQRPDVVARITARDGFTRDRLLALGRAIAAP